MYIKIFENNHTHVFEVDRYEVSDLSMKEATREEMWTSCTIGLGEIRSRTEQEREPELGDLLVRMIRIWNGDDFKLLLIPHDRERIYIENDNGKTIDSF